MKLEHLVCTYEQAAALKQFGIDQHSYFSWTGIPSLEVPLHVARTEEIHQTYSSIFYTVRKAAFTVTELMLMMQGDMLATKRLQVLFKSQLIQHQPITELITAPFLAQQLIEMLQLRLVTPESINEHATLHLEPG
jgi:hypothetical protein